MRTGRDEIYGRIEEVEKLCWAVSRRLYHHPMYPGNREDMMMEGVYGVLRFADRWDPGKLEFAAFVYSAAYHWILRYCVNQYRLFQKRAAAGIVLSLESPVNEMGYTLGESIPDERQFEEEVLERESARLLLEAAERMLDARRMRVLRMRADGRTFQEIGSAMGFRQQYANQLHQEAVRKLKKAFEEGGRNRQQR